MAILQKTWTQHYNSKPLPPLPDSRYNLGTTAIPLTLLLFKDSLKVAGWTVLASSNRTAADLNDNWVTYGDITRGGNDTWPGSWILLQAPTTPTTWLLLDYTSSIDRDIVLRWCLSQPDISVLSPYRTPEATGPEFVRTWVVDPPTSGAYEYYFTMLTATDGSFLLVGTFVGTDDDNVLMLNVLRGADTKDPYPFVIWMKDDWTDSDVFWHEYDGIHNNVWSFAPDGTVVNCSLLYPVTLYGDAYEYQLGVRSADDPNRGWKPYSWPIRVVNKTSGYLGHKGYLEDFWWGAEEDKVNQRAVRFQQPGFDGQNLVVMRRGCWWIPCIEPFKW